MKTLLAILVLFLAPSCASTVSPRMSVSEMTTVMSSDNGVTVERDDFLGRTSYWGPQCEIKKALLSFTKMWLRKDVYDDGREEWTVKLYHYGSWVNATSARDQNKNEYSVASNIDHFGTTKTEVNHVSIDADTLKVHASSMEPLRVRLYGPKHYREETIPSAYLRAFLEVTEHQGGQ